MGDNMTAYKNTGFALTKIKKIAPSGSPLRGKKRGGREMVKNYRKLKKIIISPKCPKTIQKNIKKNYFLNFCKR